MRKFRKYDLGLKKITGNKILTDALELLEFYL
jgi:hypothetical protein